MPPTAISSACVMPQFLDPGEDPQHGDRALPGNQGNAEGNQPLRARGGGIPLRAGRIVKEHRSLRTQHRQTNPHQIQATPAWKSHSIAFPHPEKRQVDLLAVGTGPTMTRFVRRSPEVKAREMGSLLIGLASCTLPFTPVEVQEAQGFFLVDFGSGGSTISP